MAEDDLVVVAIRISDVDLLERGNGIMRASAATDRFILAGLADLNPVAPCFDRTSPAARKDFLKRILVDITKAEILEAGAEINMASRFDTHIVPDTAFRVLAFDGGAREKRFQVRANG